MKLDDIPFVINDVNKDIPKITPVSVKAPLSFSQNFPKHVPDFLEKVDNKCLNNYLSAIEEISHRYPNHPYPKWMKQYQIKHFKAVLHGDGFFKQNEFGDFGKTRYYRSLSLQNVAFLGSRQHVNGADLFTATGGVNVGSFGSGNFQAFKLPNTGVIGQYYNQIAIDMVTGSGNFKYAVYDDSSTTPNNLYQQTGSIAFATGYPWNSLTEFALTTTRNWACFNNDTSATPKSTTGSSGDRQYVTQAFATSFTTPAPGGRTNGTDIANMKIGHS